MKNIKYTPTPALLSKNNATFINKVNRLTIIKIKRVKNKVRHVFFVVQTKNESVQAIIPKVVKNWMR